MKKILQGIRGGSSFRGWKLLNVKGISKNLQRVKIKKGQQPFQEAVLVMHKSQIFMPV
jgi:hypothetical protein